MQQYLMIHGRVREAKDERALKSAMRFYTELAELSATTTRNNVGLANQCPVPLRPFSVRFEWLIGCMKRTTSLRSKILPGTDGVVILQVKMLQGDGKRNVGDLRIVFSQEGKLVPESSSM